MLHVEYVDNQLQQQVIVSEEAVEGKGERKIEKEKRSVHKNRCDGNTKKRR